MNKPEQQFWTLIKDHLPGDVSRVENTADSGTPDVTAAYNGHDYWVELKVSSNKHKVAEPEYLLRPAQYVWHMRRSRHGTQIFVITKYPNKIVVHTVSGKTYNLYSITEKVKNKWQWMVFDTDIKTLILKETF